MSKNLEAFSTEELVSQFEEVGVAQYDAELDMNTRRYNKLFDRMVLIVQELKRRGGDQRTWLAAFYEHPNIQVRLKAAIHTLAVNPEGARKVLEQVASEVGYPHSADARGMLRELDEGS